MTCSEVGTAPHWIGVLVEIDSRIEYGADPGVDAPLTDAPIYGMLGATVLVEFPFMDLLDSSTDSPKRNASSFSSR